MRHANIYWFKKNKTMKKIILLIAVIFGSMTFVYSQVWQWNVKVDSSISEETKDNPQAFLWIPENCKQVKGVVFTQHNMIEDGMLEHPAFRKAMADLGFAEIWVTPGLTITFDFNKDAGEDFERMMKLLADASGYKELQYVPVVPMGHSALASFPWNFAAWNPGRTLAIVSVHGDAPQTKLTGSGRPNPDWGNRNIDGVPALFIMGEQEWWSDRIDPGFDFVSKHPNSVISFFADAGHGHFDYSDEMISYVCMFIKKAANKRLPKTLSIDKPNVLNRVITASGWLMDSWHKDSLPEAVAAPYNNYKGERKTASWIFDKQMADETEQFYAMARGKINQHIGFIQDGKILQPSGGHANYSLKFMPLSDGISFNLSAFFADTSRLIPVSNFAKTPLIISRICGPVKKVNDTTFQISFYRMGFNSQKRSNDIWLLASNKGDDKYKSMVQQLNMRFPLVNKAGIPQLIKFSTIQNCTLREKSIKLNAISSASLPVMYYVKEGPAFIDNEILKFTTIPPRSKLPLKVTVVAWQYGLPNKVQSAVPVEQSFYILK
jgi:hypothetical protein